MSAMTRIVFILVVVAFAALDGVAWADSAIAVTDEIASLDSRTPPGGVKESTDGHRAAETQMRTIVLQLVLLFLTFALALGAMLYVQRLEWQKQDLQKQIDDIEVQENCLIAVEKEMEGNHKQLEGAKQECDDGRVLTPMYAMLTVSFQSAWPMLIQSKSLTGLQPQLSDISTLFSLYTRINRNFEFVRNLVIAQGMSMAELVKMVSGILAYGLETEPKNKAAKAFEKLKHELAQRKQEVGQKLNRLQRPWWKLSA